MTRTTRHPLVPVDPFDLLRRLDPAVDSNGADATSTVESNARSDVESGSESEIQSGALPDDVDESVRLAGSPASTANGQSEGDDTVRAEFLSELRGWMRDPSPGDRLDRLVDGLRLIELRKTDPEGQAKEGELYDAARRHFQRNETSLRSQTRFTEQILEQIQGEAGRQRGQANPFQMELRLRASPGGLAAGRFVLASDLPRVATVAFRAGVLRGTTIPWNDSAKVRFDPSRPVLHAHQECVVSAAVDLAECPARPGDRLELCVDVLGDDELILKLWLQIAIDEPAESKHD